ncbi:hypothetical protein, partial [Burkholderia cenocepacia]|uniref:hypothetical protein n=1 Tax=Burkholderia cenocepacia TaxID=95486 RepID=UPI00222FD019
ICSLEGIPSEGDVVCLLDVNGPFLFDITVDEFEKLKAFMLSPTVKRVLWVTKASQMSSSDPRYGLVHGFIRALHGERHAEGACLSIFDIEEFSHQAIPHIIQVHQHLSRSRPDESRRDEFALRQGVVHVGRFEAANPDEEIQIPVKKSIPRRLG